MVELKENPYVALLARKQRNLKKKLEKITRIESQLEEGKAIDEEQKLVLNNKLNVEKSLAEVSTIKKQLEDIAKEELEKSSEGPNLTLDIIPKDKEFQEKATQLSSEAVEESKNSSSMEEIEHLIEPTIDYETANFVLESTPMPTVDDFHQLEEVGRGLEQLSIKSFNYEAKIKKFLKVFHVCLRYEATVKKPLPDKVDFFGKTLLGQTSIQGFLKTLESSLESAKLYVDDELSVQSEALRGVSYHQISEIVDSLADEMERVNAPGVVGGANAAVFGILAQACHQRNDRAVEEQVPIKSQNAGITNEEKVEKSDVVEPLEEFEAQVEVQVSQPVDAQEQPSEIPVTDELMQGSEKLGNAVLKKKRVRVRSRKNKAPAEAKNGNVSTDNSVENITEEAENRAPNNKNDSSKPIESSQKPESEPNVEDQKRPRQFRAKGAKDGFPGGKPVKPRRENTQRAAPTAAIERNGSNEKALENTPINPANNALPPQKKIRTGRKINSENVTKPSRDSQEQVKDGVLSSKKSLGSRSNVGGAPSSGDKGNLAILRANLGGGGARGGRVSGGRGSGLKRERSLGENQQKEKIEKNSK